MSQNGYIKSMHINPSGYDCCIELYINNFKTLYCYVPLINYRAPTVNTDEINVLNELINEKLILRLNDKIKANLKIVFVSTYELIYDYSESTFEQPIKDSSHAIVIAKVKDILDEYTFICSVNGLSENISVELESKISSLKIGYMIKFSGELSINFS
ncbi:hypothetical protein [Clostridium sp.]|uniref:hypothetical protein n=1 Tax=Clostridium sp. TaxID=1506 RepID=UPI00284E39CD|nr:hypothetical protein [Clostridium sp.]MDR3594147.1 hypothetical protein [Clostridium sp.]